MKQVRKKYEGFLLIGILMGCAHGVQTPRRTIAEVSVPERKISASPVRPLIFDSSEIRHLSAASGLVVRESLAYVVADDENHVGVFNIHNNSPGKLIRILDGDLPNDSKGRKQLKADFEAIVKIPESKESPHGGFLIIPSGSTDLRTRAILMSFVGSGEFSKPQVLDWSDLMKRLKNIFPELNFEGGILHKGNLRLFQRGNGSNNHNGIVDIQWKEALKSGTGLLPAEKIKIQHRQVSLPQFRGGTLRYFGCNAIKIWGNSFCGIS